MSAKSDVYCRDFGDTVPRECNYKQVDQDCLKLLSAVIGLWSAVADLIRRYNIEEAFQIASQNACFIILGRLHRVYE